MTKSFISHSSVDKPFARKLVNDLSAAGLLQVWFDENITGVRCECRNGGDDDRNLNL